MNKKNKMVRTTKPIKVPLYGQPSFFSQWNDEMDELDHFLNNLKNSHDSLVCNIIEWPGVKAMAVQRIHLHLDKINKIRKILGSKPLTEKLLINKWEEIYEFKKRNEINGKGRMYAI